MSMPDMRRRALLFVLSMGAAVVAAEGAKPRRRVDRARTGLPLESMFPKAFGAWRVDPVAESLVRPADEASKLYGIYDQVLERVYTAGEGQQVMLSVAYGSEQSNALQVHRPEVCYASSGFRVSDVQGTTLVLGTMSLAATRLLAAMPGRTEPITYWTVLGDEVVSDAGSFRWRRFAKGLGGDIPDGMLVRLSSITRDTEAAYAMHRRFAAELKQAMQPDHVGRVFGA
ncbi:hypothetical protein BURC_04460 [Burkholderiaceae bacterium]|nr:hypothetical protein BURC_04460 [Burkholderiaceae bacterium]